MPITLKTPKSKITNYMIERIERMEQVLVSRLCYIGEQCVNHARNLPSPNAADYNDLPKIPPHQPNYIDWTGNLRSSIGYVVSVDGEIVDESRFEPIKGGAEGAAQGRAYAESLVSQYPKGICLIVVAGMRYAEYVTEMRHAKYAAARCYDVIDSAELLARQLVPQMLKQLGLQ